jgi:hypothetical protein
MKWSHILLFGLASANVIIVVYETDILLSRQLQMSLTSSCISMGLLMIYGFELTTRTCRQSTSDLGAYDISRMFSVVTSWNAVDIALLLLDVLNEILALGLGKMPSRQLFLSLRLTRILRSACALTRTTALCDLLGHMWKALEVAVWGALFLAMLLSIWAVIAVEMLQPLNHDIAETGAYDDCSWCSSAFASVADANLTLLRQVVMGDGWEDVLMILLRKHPWAASVIFLAGVSINLGVLCFIVAAVMARAQEQHTSTELPSASKKESYDCAAIEELLSSIFAEPCKATHEMTIDNIIAGFESSPELRSVLRRLGIERDDLQCMFDILDDNASGSVSYHKFAEQLLRMQDHINDPLLLFIKLHTSKAQQKVEDQLIWFEQRRSASTSQTDAMPEKKDPPVWETDLSTIQKKPVIRTVTPFATLSDCQSSGSLTATNQEWGSKLNRIGSLPEEKLQSDTSVGLCINHSTSRILAAAELDKLRRQINLQLDVLSHTFSQTFASTDQNLKVSQSAGMTVIDDSKPSVAPSTPRNLHPMPAPDIAVTPPPEFTAQLQSQRPGNASASKRGSKVRPPSLSPPREEEPKSGNPISGLRRWQEATGISCCEMKPASQGQRLVIVGPPTPS